MALTPVSCTALAVLPKAGGGTIGLYLVAYNSGGAAVAASEALTQLIGTAATQIPAGMTVQAWINAAIATTSYPGAGGDVTMVEPFLDHVAQTLRYMSPGTGAIHAGGTLGTLVDARAIVLAQQD